MPESKSVPFNPDAYKKFKAEIEKELVRTQKTGTRALNAVCNDANWRIGQKLSALPEAKPWVRRLSADTGRTPLFYYRAAQFYRQWPRGLKDDVKSLAFSTLCELLPLTDVACRDFYARECVKNNWFRDSLRRAIKRDWFALAKSGQKLVSDLEPDDHPYFTYKARVNACLDGDTLSVELDLGFRVKVAQVLRLRGVNCAEIKSLPETRDRAEKARAFVQERLKEVPFVTIKTHTTDIYGRYVADVFYVPVGATDKTPRYLNRELLETGLAEGMM